MEEIYKKMEEIYKKEDKLKNIICEMGRMLIAYSGGIDSFLLAKIAVEVVGDNVLACIANSPSIPAAEFKEAVKLANDLEIPVRVIETSEFKDPNYIANSANRCYFCKSALFSVLKQMARNENFPWICYGANWDDQGDWRPGMKAAKEFGIRAPLLEAELRKSDIRAMARARNIPIWDKPAAPCISSRIPYGQPVTLETLDRIEKSEYWLREKGFKEVRVRDHYPIARIEVPLNMISMLVNEDVRQELVNVLTQYGYAYVTLDLMGFQPGNLNKLVSQKDNVV